MIPIGRPALPVRPTPEPTFSLPTTAEGNRSQHVFSGRLGRFCPSVGHIVASGSTILIGLWLLGHIWSDCRALREFDDHIGDGPFQLFNPLRRIAAGQVGGVDFHYFHGLALPYLHYPAFALLGGDFYASEVARYAISEFAYLGAFAFAFGCVTRRAGPALALTAIALVATERIAYDSLALPGVNLVGLRSTCPLLLFGLLLAGLRPSRESFAAGALTGLGLTLGTDHGLAMASMLVIVWFGRALAGLPGGRVRYLAYATAGGAAGAAGILLAIGGTGGAIGALRYAFIELPADQFWFFGVPPNRFLHLHRQLLSERYLLPTVIPPASAILALCVWMRREPGFRTLGVVLLGAMAYAIISCVGYFGYCSAHYLNPALRMLVVAALATAWHGFRWLSELPGPGESAFRAVQWLFGGFLLTFVLVGPTTAGRSSIIEARSAAREIGEWGAEAHAARCPLGPRFRAHLDALTHAIDADRAASGITRTPTLWSTYAGLLEDHYSTFAPDADYLIHAVGPARREEYLKSFRRVQPDYVCTFRRSVWPWEECLQNNCWPFYEEVVSNYGILAESWAYRLWKRRPGPWRSPEPAEGSVSYGADRPDGFTVRVPPDLQLGGGLVVEVEYTAETPLRGVPVLGGLSRFLLHPHNCENETPVSLPPYRDRWSFAVYPIPGKVPSFYAGTASLIGGKLRVTVVHVRPILANGRDRFLHDEPSVKLP